MSEIRCPLSGSGDVRLLETVKVSDLCALYYKLTRFDASSEFGDVKEIQFYHCPESDVKFFWPLVTGSGEFYDKLQDTGWYYKDEKIEYAYARGLIKPADSVLEIGCGKGAFGKSLEVKAYAGLELSARSVGKACGEGLNVKKEYVEDHAKENRDKYDVVCAFQVLEHVANTRAFVEAAVTCLKPGGLLILSVPSADSFIPMLRNASNMPPHHVTWWSDAALRHIAEIFGLRVREIEHEILADHNKPTYAYTIAYCALEDFFGLKHDLVNRSPGRRILQQTARLAAKILSGGLKEKCVRPHGHTVTAVYEKQGL